MYLDVQPLDDITCDHALPWSTIRRFHVQPLRSHRMFPGQGWRPLRGHRGWALDQGCLPSVPPTDRLLDGWTVPIIKKYRFMEGFFAVCRTYFVALRISADKSLFMHKYPLGVSLRWTPCPDRGRRLTKAEHRVCSCIF